MKHEILISEIKESQNAVIKAYLCGKNAKSRLMSMGIIPGEEVKVIKNTTKGPFIVAVKGSRVVLGRGVAHKIVVESDRK